LDIVIHCSLGSFFFFFFRGFSLNFTFLSWQRNNVDQLNLELDDQFKISEDICSDVNGCLEVIDLSGQFGDLDRNGW
jgi:hypothetical protein